MPDAAPRQPGLQDIVRALIAVAVMAGVLFWPAGTLDWFRGWLFLGAFFALMVVAVIWIWRVNPELFAARRKFGEGTKAWDLVVANLTVLSYAAILPIAGLDFRFGWSQQPVWVIASGYVLLLPGFALVTWAQAVNRHFEPTVRIQTDRDHAVISTGPYAIIRHPGYAGAAFMSAGMALALGSLYALLPVALLVVLLFGRTLGEEATLRDGLKGYTEYAQRVRWRWLPGVW